MYRINVALRVRAWIETENQTETGKQNHVALRVRAWIETVVEPS